jgi:hypothetical protein
MKSQSPFGDFVWFQGVVEDVNDPKMIGRVRVRCIGYHTEDINELPVDLLPWAPFLNGTNAMSAPNVLPGDWVVGFFLDGDQAQQPVVMGSLIGIPKQKDSSVGLNDPSGTWPRKLETPTNSGSARGESPAQEYKAHTAWGNPTGYAARYPFNHVMETDKGAMFEMDDTEGAERVCVFHHKGSYVEFLPDGTIVVKSVKERWDVTFANHTMLVNGDLSIGATGNIALTAGGNMKLSAGGTLDAASGGDLNLGAGGNSTHMAGGAIKMNGSSYDWGSGSDATGGPDSVEEPGDTSLYSPGSSDS